MMFDHVDCDDDDDDDDDDKFDDKTITFHNMRCDRTTYSAILTYPRGWVNDLNPYANGFDPRCFVCKQ